MSDERTMSTERTEETLGGFTPQTPCPGSLTPDPGILYEIVQRHPDNRRKNRKNNAAALLKARRILIRGMGHSRAVRPPASPW